VRDGRKLLFEVEVVDQDQRTIGVGTHQRRMIDARGASAGEADRRQERG
jgi:predicted thioesterase